ncbi:hypothetical protein [Deinococcus hopiensis]|uniref:Uncharacterized protein n=1 Tax=Deinococcus hopiensis KR-140 TaxID=695939 RepID=A0A1W1VRR4_9DEIO|nr:hypothetical protein [Deinococcus hopiensis]SMB96026.1 hypothetical protein SAMN00790413_03119 [Deinococcus hopiensis KR-140]
MGLPGAQPGTRKAAVSGLSLCRWNGLCHAGGLAPTQQDALRITAADQARALRRHHGFLGQLLTPRSPTRASPWLGTVPNPVRITAPAS